MELGRQSSFKATKFMVVGHRGHGMNQLQSADGRMKAFKENTILSFNSAAKLPLDFIEFDVQVSLRIRSVLQRFLAELLRIIFVSHWVRSLARVEGFPARIQP